MKKLFQISIVLLFTALILGGSAGVMVYQHYCSQDDEFRASLNQFEGRCCDEKLNKVTYRKHVDNVEVESCCSAKNDACPTDIDTYTSEEKLVAEKEPAENHGCQVGDECCEITTSYLLTEFQYLPDDFQDLKDAVVIEYHFEIETPYVQSEVTYQLSFSNEGPPGPHGRILLNQIQVDRS